MTMLSIVTLFLSAALSLYNGTAQTWALGKEESQDNLVLNVEGEGSEKKVFLQGYGAFGFNNISISGTIILDDEGSIGSFKDVVVKGVPVKIKTVAGTITEKGTDVTLEGKAASVFNFKVRYKAVRQQ